MQTVNFFIIIISVNFLRLGEGNLGRKACINTQNQEKIKEQGVVIIEFCYGLATHSPGLLISGL